MASSAGDVTARTASADTDPTALSILFVSTVASTIRQFLMPYAVDLRQKGWRVSAAASGVSDDPAFARTFDHLHEVPLTRSILDVRGIIRGWRAIEAAVSAGYDIVHVHTPIASFLARLAVRRMPLAERPSVVYTVHGFHFFRGGRRLPNLVFRTAERVAGRWTDRLIVINDEDHEAAAAHRIVPRVRLIRMPGIGVDTSVYSRQGMTPDDLVAARRSAGLPAVGPYFVVIAELSARKRVEDVVAALAGMRYVDAHLAILGDGPHRAGIEAQIASLDLSARVHLIGFSNEVRPIVAGATALVLSSTREGLARSIMEALSLEVPVIASTARGNAELVQDDGFVVPVGSVADITLRMDWLIDHPAEGAAMGRRGRDRMVQRFDIRKLIDEHESLYRSLLDERTSVMARY